MDGIGDFGSIVAGWNPGADVNRGLRAWYLAAAPYDGGTRWYDATERYPGTLTGFTARAWHGSPQRWGQLLLDGSASYVAMPSAVGVLASKNFTYSCWIATTSTTTGLSIISEGSSSSITPEFVIQQDSVTASLARCLIRDDINGTYIVTGTKAINDGLWHHIAVSWGGGTLVLYVDGVQDGTVNAAAATTFAVNQVTIGCLRRTTNVNFFPGSIDDVRIYARSLSSVEVLTLYRESLAGYPDALSYRRLSPSIFVPAFLPFPAYLAGYEEF